MISFEGWSGASPVRSAGRAVRPGEVVFEREPERGEKLQGNNAGKRNKRRSNGSKTASFSIGFSACDWGVYSAEREGGGI